MNSLIKSVRLAKVVKLFRESYSFSTFSVCLKYEKIALTYKLKNYWRMVMAKITPEDALEYHRLDGKPGKISVVSTKPMDTQRDLSLAYTPGVAVPVLEIEKDAEAAYEYTSKGNLVAVITNGTAILGLGDRGALASNPVR